MTVLRAVRGGAALAFLAAFGALAQPAEPKLSRADWNAIRDVVVDQRDALATGDATRAFAYATPGIRKRFGDPATFLSMVREAYAPLVEARDAQPLEGMIVEGRIVQPLQLVMPDNAVLIAIYTLERQPGGAWRISGCVVAESSLRAT